MNEKITKKVLYALAEKVCGKNSLTGLNDAEKHAIAIELYKQGYTYACSSFGDIATYGYGMQDISGFFEYSLYEKDIKPGLNKRRIQQKETENVC